MCPECGSLEVTIEEYDFGTCPQTGYHDAGERFRWCLWRGGRRGRPRTGRDDTNSISVGSSERPRGGGWRDCTLRLARGLKTRFTRVDTDRCK